MKLYLVRHADAVPRGKGHREEARPLTPKGERQFRAAAKGLKRAGVRFDRLLFSPWLRAAQTADFLVPLVEGESQATLLLAQTPPPELLEMCAGGSVALVGHQPWLGELAGLLMFGDMDAGSRFELDKGGVALLEGRVRSKGMVLKEWWSARTLERLGE